MKILCRMLQILGSIVFCWLAVGVVVYLTVWQPLYLLTFVAGVALGVWWAVRTGRFWPRNPAL
jgi:hypothetical protein